MSIVLSISIILSSRVPLLAAQETSEDISDVVFEMKDNLVVDEADVNGANNIGNPYKHPTKTISYSVTDENDNSHRETKAATVWDCVWFGNYWQDSSDKYGSKQPIKWRVLSVNGNDAFIMADKGLDSQKYSIRLEDTWENCMLRTWLNGDFYNDTFDSEQKNAIIKTVVVNENNPCYGTAGGNDTDDNVFLLSIAECFNPDYGFDNLISITSVQGSAFDPARQIKETPFAVARGAANGGPRYTGYWWLRSPGYNSRFAADVEDGGEIDKYGYHLSETGAAVRPVLHLDLSSCWNVAGTVCSDGTYDEDAATGQGEKDSDPIHDPQDESPSDDKNEFHEVVPATEGAIFASKEDNFAFEAKSGKITDLMINFENVGASSVSADKLKATVVKGTKLTTAERVKNIDSNDTKAIKVKIDKRSGVAAIKPKASGVLTIMTENGKTYKIAVTVEAPKAQKTAKKQSISTDKQLKLTLKDMFNTTVDGGKLSATSKAGQSITVSNNCIVLMPKESDKIKVNYSFLNKRYKTTITIK